jgi:hypothetical protein
MDQQALGAEFVVAGRKFTNDRKRRNAKLFRQLFGRTKTVVEQVVDVRQRGAGS